MSVALDAGRIPRRYSVVAAVFCCLWPLFVVVVVNGSLVARMAWGIAFAILAAASYLVFRVQFKKTFAKPFPPRGVKRWLAGLPGWLLVPGYLAYVLILPGIAAVVAYISFPGHLTGLLFGVLPVAVIGVWADASAWLALRRLSTQ